jgi:hypothetical protein
VPLRQCLNSNPYSFKFLSCTNRVALAQAFSDPGCNTPAGDPFNMVADDTCQQFFTGSYKARCSAAFGWLPQWSSMMMTAAMMAMTTMWLSVTMMM